ncbi:hypothetical protein GCM10010307_52560 [Streptomyces vastus]|uniref:Uncharacterized protein n=1 Tax=Streptomyces vastus TaxID=285451 RepID=A0ABN3R8Z0_9ACTN
MRPPAATARQGTARPAARGHGLTAPGTIAVPLAVAGAARHTLPAPGVPLLILGLADLIAGMQASLGFLDSGAQFGRCRVWSGPSGAVPLTRSEAQAVGPQPSPR